MADEQSAQPGLDLLDFDVLGYELVTIKKTVPLLDAETDEPVLDAATGQFVTERRTWGLRDDVPMEMMVRLFALLEREQEALATAARAAGDDERGAAQAQRALAALEREDAVVTRVCLDIFRHTYPGIREAQVRQWFTFTERRGIADRFFAHRGRLSWRAQPPTPSAADLTPAPISTPLPPLAPAQGPRPSQDATPLSGASRGQTSRNRPRHRRPRSRPAEA